MLEYIATPHAPAAIVPYSRPSERETFSIFPV